MSTEPIMFGRAIRFVCDEAGCEERQTVSTGGLGDANDLPHGWGYAGTTLQCPEHSGRDGDDFDDLCDELMSEDER